MFKQHLSYAVMVNIGCLSVTVTVEVADYSVCAQSSPLAMITGEAT